MKSVIPGNDRQRQTFLADALITARSDQEINRLQLSGQLFGEMKRMQENLDKGLDALKTAYHGRRAGIADRNRAQEILSGSVRRTMASLYNWLAGENLPVNLLDLCKLPTDGPRPNPKNGTQWVLVAKDLLKGYQKLTARGYTPFVYPTTQRLTADLTRLEAVLEELSQARTDLQEAQIQMRSLRQTFTHLHRGVALYLRYKTVTLKAPAQREVMRRYGFVFTPSGRIPRQASQPTVVADDVSEVAAAIKSQDVVRERSDGMEEGARSEPVLRGYPTADIQVIGGNAGFIEPPVPRSILPVLKPPLRPVGSEE